MGVYESHPQEYNKKLAEALKKVPEFQEPEWLQFVKSGAGKERPIEDPDFWYNRSASILRQLYKREVVGVNRLRTKYGNRQRRGARPPEFKKASGKIIRVILQQCDKVGFTELIKETRAARRRKLGRVLTKKGKEFMEAIK